MAIFYFLSPRVTRSLVYGLAARNRLDLYRPPSNLKRPPEGYKVVIYITGAKSRHLAAHPCASWAGAWPADWGVCCVSPPPLIRHQL